MPGLCMVFLCLKSYSHVLIAWLSACVNQTFMAVTKYLTENWKGRKFSFGSVFQRFWHFLLGKVWWNWAAHAMGGQGADRDAWSHWGPHEQGSAAYIECQSIPLWKLREKLLISVVLSNPVKLVIKIIDSHITLLANPPGCQACTTSTLPT